MRHYSLCLCYEYLYDKIIYDFEVMTPKNGIPQLIDQNFPRTCLMHLEIFPSRQLDEVSKLDIETLELRSLPGINLNLNVTLQKTNRT